MSLPPADFVKPGGIAQNPTDVPSLRAAGGMVAGLVWTINRGDLRSDDQEGLYFPPAIDTDRIYLAGNYEVDAFKKR